jgi:hypothetical protein
VGVMWDCDGAAFIRALSCPDPTKFHGMLSHEISWGWHFHDAIVLWHVPWDRTVVRTTVQSQGINPLGVGLTRTLVDAD